MDLNVLRTFLTVCEYGSFTAAANKLGYSQPTVSAQIKQLEIELDTVLFDRIKHNTALTSKGKMVQKHAELVLRAYQDMIEAMKEPEHIAGEIRLAMADSVCSKYFMDDYIEFQKLYPDITIKITSAGTEQMFDMLRKNEADIVFTLDSHIYDNEYIICAESTEAVHFVADANSELVKKGCMEIEDIINERFFLTQPGMSYRRTMDTMLAEKSLSIKPVIEISSPDQICRMLQKGNAVSLLPDYVTDPYIKSGQLKYLEINNFNIEVWNQILIHRNKWLSPAMNALISFYKEIISKRR